MAIVLGHEIYIFIPKFGQNSHFYSYIHWGGGGGGVHAYGQPDRKMFGFLTSHSQADPNEYFIIIGQ